MERAGEVSVYRLVDKETGLVATVSPSEGGQVTDMSFKGESILRSPRGIPILFPWPNRIRDAKFTFKGKTVKLVPTSKEGYALHGLVMRKNWKVENKGMSKDGAHIEVSLRSLDFPDIGEQFPYPFKIAVDWIVRDGSLEFTATAANEGKETMPMGFGVHTNFRIPIRDIGSRENCWITVPADSYWELEEHAIGSGRLIPTGRKLSVTGKKFDLRKPKPIGDLLLDDGLTDLRMEEGWAVCKLYDPIADITILNLSDQNFKHICVFIPPNRGVSIEPYTCATDAFNLESRGIKAGMIALEPGEKWSGTIRIIPKAGKLI